MCGLAGIVGPAARDRATLRRMGGAIAHRGPDDSGLFIDEQSGIGLAHRRLAIVDITSAGHQPLASADGRFVICYNGEVYNHLALRSELEREIGRHTWRGHSDTETLVECIARWGVRRTLDKSVGMFALALWDRKERRLILARDRFGEKPLYYGRVAGNFAFASELKALRSLDGFANEIDPKAVNLLLQRNYIPAPLSIYRRIFKLEPGTILSLSPEKCAEPHNQPLQAGESGSGWSYERYWSHRDVIVEGLAHPFPSHDEALENLFETLSVAVKGQMIADVPIGAFLSGGIDSSAIVALYQRYSRKPVKTYSIGFEDAAFDESGYARAVARQLGTEHHEQIVTVKEAREVIPELPRIYDEPFADSSQIPTFLVSRFARNDVTVAITGDGGDELFGGYTRHSVAPRLWRSVNRVPVAVRELGRGIAGRTPEGWWSRAATFARGQPSSLLGAKLQKAVRIATSARHFDQVYGEFLNEWQPGEQPVPAAANDILDIDSKLGGDASEEVRSMYWDSISYLPDDILCKVDRASMAVSLETRVPFLDHRVAAVAARIPIGMKMQGGVGKQILRDLLFREAPRQLFDRPKAGFGVPVGDWLRSGLRDWAEDLLDARKLRDGGLVDPDPIRRRWEEHLSGKRDFTASIWSVLMLQQWTQTARETD